ncbi:MAG: GAF domain-containing protein [Xenococcaceae cyanobacterium]
MNQNFSPESNSEQYKVKSELNSDKTKINKALTNISEQFNPPEEKSTDSLLNLTTAEEDVLNGSNTDLETDSEHNLIRKLSQKQLKLKIVTILTSAVVMLPILILGTATYYFGNKAINRQAILARRTDNTGISQIELAKQRQLLATLLIGTGTTALMAGIFTAFVANRTFRSMSKRNTVIVKPKAEPKQINPQKSIAQFLDYLNQSFDRESIMSATVEEAQRLLECDRVVIYRFNHNNCAEVIAEAVVPGWIKAIGLTIKDSCFETDYKEKCLDGRVKIVDNIDDVNLEPCYVEQLKKLEIKANLVAPIIHQERLFGLLAAHQCSQSRSWQPNEVELLTRLAQRVSFVLDNTQLLAESKLLKEQAETEVHWTQCLSDVVRHMRQSLQKQDILDVGVEEVRRVLNCDRVVVYSLNEDDQGVVIAESVAPGFTRALGLTIVDPCFEARYLEQYQNGRVKAIENVYEADMMACYLEQLEKLEVKANLVTPIIHDNHLFGLLVAHQCANPRSWQQQEILWVTQVATQVGLALDNAQLSTKLLAESSQLDRQQTIENQWTQFFTDAVKHIRQSLQQKDILDISVKEVRRVLDCDRVLIYSLNQDNYGIVIAESIAPGFPKALGITIEDPCFEARYLEQYQSGRVRALNNIYEAGITACYLEQLEKLAVKANLVTPIINEGKIFGLLVAHQCANPRNWQQHEIRWLTQIATQVGFALDNAKLLAESSQLKQKAELETKWMELFINVMNNIRRSLQPKNILDVSVEEVRRALKCDRAVIYSLNQENQGVVIAESVAPGFTRALGLTIEDPCFEARYLEKYQNGRVKAIDNVYEADMMACYLEQLEKLEVKANLVTPIIHEGNLFGLLVAHQCANPRSWQQQEILWLTQIAAQVGFALDNAKLLKQLEDNKLPSPPSQNPNLQKLAQDRDSQEKSAQKQNIPTKTPVPKREISGLLLESKKGFETLLLKVNEQSDLIAQFLVQMQKVTELAQALETTEPSLSSSANLEVEQDEVEAKINTTSFKDNLIKVADKITQSAQEIKQINSSAKKLYQIGNLINKLIQQIDQQITDTALQLDELERNNRRSFVSIAKRVKPLTYQLSIQTQQVETLMGEISVIAQEIINVLNFNADHTSGVTKATKGTQNLIQLNAAINAKVQTLRVKITQVVEQTQNLAVVSQFILQVATSAGNALPIRA